MTLVSDAAMVKVLCEIRDELRTLNYNIERLSDV